MAALGGPVTRPGIVDLYREIWGAGSALAARYRLGLVVEVVLVATYAVLRTAGAPREALLGWAAAALVTAVVSPPSGLVVLAAIAPFSEPFTVSRQLGFKPVLVVALALGVALRLLFERPFRRPPVPIVLAALLAIGTLAGVGGSMLLYGAEFGKDAAQSWLAGIGGGLLVLIVAYEAARAGHRRAFVVAIASAAIGGVVSLADYVDAEAVRGTALGWVLRPNRFENRLTGIIPSPNGVASLVVVPTAVLLVAAALAAAWSRWMRVAAALVAVPLVLALYFTYSRAALLALFVVAVVVAWRFRRRLGIAVLVAGLVLGALLLPAYLQVRSQTGSASAVQPGGLIVASDIQRLNAWGAAARMWVARPLTGHGFLSYGVVHEAYGDPVLNAPHNEWLRLFAEEGIAVGIVGVAFAVTSLIALARPAGWLTAACFAGFAGWCLAATFNNPTGYIQVGVIAFTVLGTGLAVAYGRAAEEP
jgi:O-antigen ligase